METTEHTPRLLSTQRYTDVEIVAEKLATEDYAIQVVWSISGTVGYVIDGHHSLAAAIDANVEPEIEEPEWAAAEMRNLGFEAYVIAHHNGDDLYDVRTGADVEWDEPEIAKADYCGVL